MVLGCAVELHNIGFDSMYFLYIVLYTGSFYANTIWIYMQMTQDEIIKLAKEIAWQYGKAERFQTWTHDYMMDRLMELVTVSAAAEREACLALHDHDDVLAPIGASVWGEAHQAGWAEGTAAYWKAIRARGQA